MKSKVKKKGLGLGVVMGGERGGENDSVQVCSLFPCETTSCLLLMDSWLVSVLVSSLLIIG